MARPGAVVMGLGYATLVAPASGAACVIADDAGGMHLASVVLQASEVPAGVDASLLRWGGDGSASNPSVLSDVFCRVGGPGSLKVRASVMVHVAASHVVLDNLWLWRADHAELSPGEQPRSRPVHESNCRGASHRGLHAIDATSACTRLTA